jgi:tRNA (guanine37-N1)-methyltransferase
MKAPALRVPVSEGEAHRRRLQEAELLDDRLRILAEGDWLWLPLRAVPGELPPGSEVQERDFPPQNERRPRDYRDLLNLPPELHALLPRSFDVLGEVVLIRLPSELEPQASAIGEALLQFVPGARIVGEDGGVQGPTRVRALRPIAGTGSFRTPYRENGLEFVVDSATCYFSPRLAREHARVAALVRPGERLLDLCCGLGPFGLTAARREATLRVVAVDVNPAAIALLRENAVRLGVADRIDARLADAEEELARLGRFDRVVLNLPHDGARFLPRLEPHVEPGGTLEYYEIVDRDRLVVRAESIRTELGNAAAWTVTGSANVHEYSPGAVLRRHTFKFRPGRSERCRSS